MGGAKYVHGVEICSEECCPGYEEVIDNPPLLSPGKAWEDEELGTLVQPSLSKVSAFFQDRSCGL